jgi:hypothetical protein
MVSWLFLGRFSDPGRGFCPFKMEISSRNRRTVSSSCWFRSSKKRQEPPTPCKLDGEAEAKLIAMRLGKPPAGYGHWTLQLLADETGGLGSGGRDQSRDGSQDAKKNGMTKRKIEHWVIPPEQDGEFVACMEEVLWKPMRKPTIRSIPSCAWTNSRSSCAGRGLYWFGNCASDSFVYARWF